jgi:hypothetical protein
MLEVLVLTRSQRKGPPEGKVKFTIQGQRVNLFEVQLKVAGFERTWSKFYANHAVENRLS